MPQQPGLPSVREATDTIASNLELDGAGLTVVRPDDEWHRSLHGNLEAVRCGGVGFQRCMDPGALGFTPWIDPEAGIGGVFAVRDRVRCVLRELPPLQAAVLAAVPSRAAKRPERSLPGASDTRPS